MILLAAIFRRTCSAIAGSIQNYRSEVSELGTRQKIYLTNRFQEECVVVEVVLNEENVSLVLVASSLYHDVQRPLRGWSVSRPGSTVNCAYIFIHVQKRHRAGVLDGMQWVRILLDNFPSPLSTTIPVTSGDILRTGNRQSELRGALSTLP